MEETEHVLNAKGEFAVHEEEIDLTHYRFEDWAAFTIFWVLGVVILIPANHVPPLV